MSTEARYYLQIFTLIIWIVAFLSYVRYILAFKNPENRKEKLIYSLGVMSWVLHSITFYAFLVFEAVADPNIFMAWSNYLRIHGGIALIFSKYISTETIKIRGER